MCAQVAVTISCERVCVRLRCGSDERLRCGSDELLSGALHASVTPDESVWDLTPGQCVTVILHDIIIASHCYDAASSIFRSFSSVECNSIITTYIFYS